MKSFVLALALVAGAGIAEAQTAAYRYQDPIVFQRLEQDPATHKELRHGKLWVMELDGSHLRQLTHGASYDEHGSFYSDKQHVLYAEFDDGYLNHEQGGRLVRLDIYSGEREVIGEQSGCSLHHASLSPLGDELIAYHRDCGPRRSQWVGLGDQAYEIAMRATNGVRTREGIIAMHEKNPAREGVPREVSLMLITGRDGGTRAELLTDDKLLHRRAAISPDGERMAWQTNAPDGGEDEIYIADIDGSNARNLTQAEGNDGHPWFSRDGRWIVFESDRSGNWEIWRMRADGSYQRQLTDGKDRYVSTRARM